MKKMANTGEEHKRFDRLPKTVVPKHYDITLKPDLEKFTFSGKEVVDVCVNEKTNEIVLNAVELVFNTVSFVDKGGKEISSLNFNISEETEVATIKFPVALEPGKGRLLIDFSGTLNDKLKGFYRSKYTTPDGETRFAATTQFEPTAARRAFPCWDEPAVKATFDITIIAPKDRVTISNMNVVEEKPDDDPNYKMVRFATTPIMSTYLVAFVVGEYDFVEEIYANRVKVRVYTPLKKRELGKFALQVTLKALEYYEKYFDIPYPLPKMDLIGIPDFASGAMENWGLITYRETRILFDPKNSSTIVRQQIALTIAHELAHQWFGNLVTMEWWTHLWLNEGFAKFMEYLCIDHIFPNFGLWTQFVSGISNDALSLDGLHNSHPIEVTVSHPSEIDEIFDVISYFKGASILRMLHDYIGDDYFRRGLSLYLKKYSYKNTETEDLWNSLEEVCKKPIGKMMSTWTKQKGYPIITVTLRQDGNNRILCFTQEKYSSNGKLSEVDKNSLWMVPISIITQLDANSVFKKLLLESRTTEVVLTGVSTDHWVKLNPRCYGFYVVNYSPDMLQHLLPSVKNKSLPPLDRLSLQSDVYALVKSGQVSTVELLKLLESFVDEDNYAVLVSINSCLDDLNSLLSHTDYQEAFHVFGQKLLSRVHAKLGWDAIDNEEYYDTLLRNLVIRRLVFFKDQNVIKEAKKRFDAHVAGTSMIPPDLQFSVYSAIAGECNDETFETLLLLYRKSDLQEEKLRISYAMAVVTDCQRIQKMLNFALSEEVRSQDAVHVLSFVASTREGRDLTWKFFKDNEAEFRSRYPEGNLCNRLVKFVAENFASEAKAKEVEDFFSSHPFPGTERTLQQSLETIRLKAEWLSRDSSAIKTHLVI